EYTRDRGGWSLASLGCHVTPANEQNLETEGGGWTAEWYTRINWWNLEWAAEFMAQTGCPKERLHWPAVAYGHSDDQNDLGYIGLDICRESIEAYGVLNSHPYWFAADQVLDRFRGHRFELLHDLFPDKPIFCAESGGMNVLRATAPAEIIQWFESLYAYDYVLAGTPFIAQDPTGQHSINDWSRRPEILQLVTAHPKTGGGSVPVPVVGAGFAKCEPFVGPWLESEVWHFPGTIHEVSLAVGQQGYATWCKATNETTAYVVAGQEVWTDRGNLGDGNMRRVQ
ncbi:MAG: hypothetical protein V2A73_16645, partial [Pseudomonadota bacterium]